MSGYQDHVCCGCQPEPVDPTPEPVAQEGAVAWWCNRCGEPTTDGNRHLACHNDVPLYAGTAVADWLRRRAATQRTCEHTCSVLGCEPCALSQAFLWAADAWDREAAQRGRGRG